MRFGKLASGLMPVRFAKGLTKSNTSELKYLAAINRLVGCSSKAVQIFLQGSVLASRVCGASEAICSTCMESDVKAGGPGGSFELPVDDPAIKRMNQTREKELELTFPVGPKGSC